MAEDRNWFMIDKLVYGIFKFLRFFLLSKIRNMLAHLGIELHFHVSRENFLTGSFVLVHFHALNDLFSDVLGTSSQFEAFFYRLCPEFVVNLGLCFE